jgi:tRNA G37 N-methylase Trm5
VSDRGETSDLLGTYYNALEGNPTLHAYHERHGTESALILTNHSDEHASLVADFLRERVAGKVVVEVGAGIGILAMYVALDAAKVYAIEVDPAWSSVFVWQLYKQKPKNLCFIFGDANEAPPIKADVAFFCTHSGHKSLREAASRFAPVVIDVYRELMGNDEYEAKLKLARQEAEALRRVGHERSAPR